MELQWPLILFTTFIAWCCGVFATQCILAFKGQGKKIQLICWVITAVLLVIGSVAVFLHLQHWERIFNGFGHLTSGITQELIMIVVCVVVAVVYMVFLRRSDDGASAPKWICIVGVVATLGLDIIMAHSYMMDSRPAWANVTEILSIVGASCVMGPATVAIVEEIRQGESEVLNGLLMLGGSVINLVFTLAYIIYMAFTQGSYTYVPYYFDPNLPDVHMRDYTQLTPFGSDHIVFTVVVLLLAIIAVLASLVGYLYTKKKDEGEQSTGLVMKMCVALGNKKWRVLGGVTLGTGFFCALVLRVLFYLEGVSVFAYYMVNNLS